MTRALRLILIVFSAALSTALVLAGLTLSASSPASAQPAEPDFERYAQSAALTDGGESEAERYLQLPLGARCPADTTLAGSVTGLPGAPPFIDEIFAGTYCRPVGFAPITDQATCEDVGYNWVSGGSLAGICAYDGAGPPQGTCPPPFVNGEGSSTDGIFQLWCLLQPLVEVVPVASAPLVPVCIESDLVVQNAPTGHVGSQFNANGVQFLITAGAPTCQVNCAGGFDFNCDDVVGDFCPVELDQTTVAGVHNCIEMFAALADAQAVETAAASPAVPAVAAAAAVTPVEAERDATLAMTGSESGLLAYLGLGFVAFGATALGVRRVTTERSD